MLSSYSEIMQAYSGDSVSGILHALGKFESCHWGTVAFWEMAMNGAQDETLDGDYVYDVFFVTSQDIVQYGLTLDTYAVILHEDESGFVYADWVTEEAYSFFEDTLLAGEEL